MNPLVGHRAATAAFAAAMAGGRLHHAWLIAGAPGIGKARFAAAAALRLLAEAAGPAPATAPLDVPDDHPVARLVAAGSHPDFVRLERPEDAVTGALKRSIPIEQVRQLLRRFATTPSLSPRRVVLIDGAEDMERAAANALLKALEEPPAGTVFLLVSHAPGRLLPTIRSRCRLLALQPLADAETATVLRAERPDLAVDEIAALAAAAGGAPGTALRYAGLDVAGLDAALDRLVRHGDPSNAIRGPLARALGLKSAQPRYEAFLDRAPARLAAEARRGRAEAVGLWEEARRLADGAVRLSLDPQVTVFELAGLVARLAPSSGDARG